MKKLTKKKIVEMLEPIKYDYISIEIFGNGEIAHALGVRMGIATFHTFIWTEYGIKTECESRFDYPLANKLLNRWK